MRALEAHFELMRKARERGDVHTVPGRAYPVSSEEMQAWIQREQSKRLHREKMLRYRKRPLSIQEVFA